LQEGELRPLGIQGALSRMGRVRDTKNKFKENYAVRSK
jgi:hypothetical protein